MAVITDYTKVTTILNPFSGYDSVPSEILKRAQEKGTAVHKLIQTFLENDDVDLMVDLLDAHKWVWYLDSMKAFWNYSWEILCMESRFYNDQYMITGQADLIVETREGNVLIDWKTSCKPNPTWHAQGSAYSWLAKQKGFEVDEIWFVKLDKIGKAPQVHKFKEDFGAFLKCYDCYHMYFKNKKEITLED